MHTEIERKFIVTDSTFKQSAVRIMDIRQGCLARLEYEIPFLKRMQKNCSHLLVTE